MYSVAKYMLREMFKIHKLFSELKSIHLDPYSKPIIKNACSTQGIEKEARNKFGFDFNLH